MEEVLNSIFDNAVADMENAFIKMLGGKKMNINTDNKMNSVFGNIELLELIPTDENSVNVTFLNEEGNFCEELLTDFSLVDIIGIGEYVDDYGAYHL